MKTKTAIKICARMMVQMLEIGWEKEDLPELEKIFWRVRDHRTGEVKKKKVTA